MEFSALSNIRIHEIEPMSGECLRLLNISNSDDYDLGGHFLQQNLACTPVCRFRFPYNTVIRAGQTVTVNSERRVKRGGKMVLFRFGVAL